MESEGKTHKKQDPFPRFEGGLQIPKTFSWGAGGKLLFAKLFHYFQKAAIKGEGEPPKPFLEGPIFSLYRFGFGMDFPSENTKAWGMFFFPRG